MPKEEFASRPTEIIEHLQEILGATGSALVERLIVREIRKEFLLDGSNSAALTSVINQARSKFMSVKDSKFR